ncbi:hypothetical protein PXH69_24345 [Rhodococcus qingshengii]|uniref:Uncharacterized protein n=1 Tax=Rhodococcus qingshengii TaxID=334542 RepID=A0AAW6LPL3_RHOSG|nr:hypothetical protein [Rhodococcus qingshengii]MDE8648101.1 hypothetical protein [Rhodococcus qingshengii]
MSDPFWDEINRKLDRVESATTADSVIEILGKDGDYLVDGDAFFAGSGGDRPLFDALWKAGWHMIWSEASYFYVVQNNAGELMTYIEGDVYRGDKRPDSAR